MITVVLEFDQPWIWANAARLLRRLVHQQASACAEIERLRRVSQRLGGGPERPMAGTGGHMAAEIRKLSICCCIRICPLDPPSARADKDPLGGVDKNPRGEVGVEFIRPLIFLRTGAAALAVWLAGCAAFEVRNEPLNRPLTGKAADALAAGRDDKSVADDLMVGLAFSGGGTRAAAFSFGVLSEIDRTRVSSRAGSGSLLDRVNFVSGVSGGSVLTAYYGLKRRAALDDFRERFLLRNAEESLNTSVSPLSVVRAVAGGVNDSSQFARWLNDNLFDGATFNDIRHTRGAPAVWINASDIYNRTAFVFGTAAFAALCSDLASYPLADAVAASAAAPVVFAPVVLKSYPQQCADKSPEWIKRARHNPNTAPMLKAYADALARYHNGSMSYVKLLDGGLVDNFGLSGFTIGRLSSDTPYGPLTPQAAVTLRRAIIIIVDAGRGPSGNWAQTVEGPGGPELMMAAADTAIDASVRASFTAFKSVMEEWEGALVRWRCALSAPQREKLGAPPDWNCRDLRFYVNRVGFDHLGPERAAALNAVPTRFTLPPEQVDALIMAGRDALRENALFRDFLAGVGRGSPQAQRVPPARVADSPPDAALAAAR
jgi:NTE family protein